MSVKMLTFPKRDEWLKARKNYIGGSDASAVVGMNPYKSNVDLWLEKTGQVIPEDISDKPYVKYGQEAEHHLRELFKLDFPEYQVFYEENNMFFICPEGHVRLDFDDASEEERQEVIEAYLLKNEENHNRQTNNGHYGKPMENTGSGYWVDYPISMGVNKSRTPTCGESTADYNFTNQRIYQKLIWV